MDYSDESDEYFSEDDLVAEYSDEESEGEENALLDLNHQSISNCCDGRLCSSNLTPIGSDARVLLWGGGHVEAKRITSITALWTPDGPVFPDWCLQDAGKVFLHFGYDTVIDVENAPLFVPHYPSADAGAVNPVRSVNGTILYTM